MLKSAVTRRIPLHKPSVGKEEAEAAAKAILDGHLVGRGSVGGALEEELARSLKAKHVQLTTSGTHAIELALAVLGVGPGDEVILPSFTFSSVANAVLRQRAKPVFCDVTQDTLNVDVDDLASRVTRKTKAVIAVHYAGVACDMDRLKKLCRAKGLFLVEDAAHSVGASWRGKPLGSIGDAGCISFHSTKNVTCGEGGAFVTSSDALARRAEWFREKGTNRQQFLRGEIKKYTWVSEGSSYVLSDILAAVLAEQWKKLPAINAARGRLYRRYMEGLAPLERAGHLKLPVIPKGCASSYHLLHVLMRTPALRNKAMDFLKGRGIGATFHYQALSASPFARKQLGWKERLPVSEKASDTLLRLPLYEGLSEADVDFVCASLAEAVK